MARETPAEKQTRARLMCEKDKLSQADIAARMKVTERTIANWAERGLPNPLKGPWVKGSLSAKVQEKEEEGVLEAAKARGLDAGYFLDKVKELCDSSKPNIIDIGLTHAERIIPGLKANENVTVNFPEKMLAFFQEHT